MHPWHDIPLGKGFPHRFNVVIEIPFGSSNKYELDKELGVFKLDRPLYSPVHYPADYGFIPQTYWEDDDPLDVVVLSHNPVATGIVMEVRPIGVLRMIDQNQQDDKILAVPVSDPWLSEIKDLKDIPKHVIKEMRHFFRIYKELQGLKAKVLSFLDKKAAEKTLLKGRQLYKKRFGK